MGDERFERPRGAVLGPVHGPCAAHAPGPQELGHFRGPVAYGALLCDGQWRYACSYLEVCELLMVAAVANPPPNAHSVNANLRLLTDGNRTALKRLAVQ